MDNDSDLDAFFDKVRAIKLSVEEKEEIRQALVRVAEESSLTVEMQDPLTDLRTAAQATKLSASEKNASKQAIMQFVRQHPLPAESEEEESVLFSKLALFLSVFRFTPLLACLMLMLLGAGVTSVAAEAALPGDTLYPVKIHVNEAVRTAFASISTEAQARLETKLTSRRLAEVKALAERGGPIPQELEQQVTDGVAKQLRRANDGIEKMSNSTVRSRREAAIKAQAEFEASLREHQEDLVRLTEERVNREERIEATIKERQASSSSSRKQAGTRMIFSSTSSVPNIADIAAREESVLESVGTVLRQRSSRGSEASSQSSSVFSFSISTPSVQVEVNTDASAGAKVDVNVSIPELPAQ